MTVSSIESASMGKVLIADNVSEECARILTEGGVEVDHRGKMTQEELKEAIGDYEGVVVRSAVKVTADILEAAPKLKIVGRAGIGVDNIDQEAATKHGVIVMNTPLGNVTAAAEHALALIMDNSRNVSRADRSMREGKWARKENVGVELEGKTLGIVGLGKIGSRVASYGKTFNMKVLGYDPMLVKERAEVLGVELMELDQLLEESDFISLHVPKTEKTLGMIGKDQFKRMKKSARLVNTSRGGVVDEIALHEALLEGEIGGAALDVYETEPPATDHPLLENTKVTLTPHLAASTEEAQIQVARDIGDQFVEYFKKGIVINATNLSSVSDASMAAFLVLSEDLGLIASQLSDGKVECVEVTYMGQVSKFDTSSILQAAIKGALYPSIGDQINVVNARVKAKDLGVEVVETRRKDALNYKSLLSVRVKTDQSDKTAHGTLFEEREPRITRINMLDIDLRPSRNMLYMQYSDVPGMVGKIGTILGEHEVNIARMEVGRVKQGDQAVILLTLDDPASKESLEALKTSIHPTDLRSITIS